MVPVSNEKEIQVYLHCGLCINELAESTEHISLMEYQQIEVGWTPSGIQVWCKRHNCNVLHVDFEGQQHKANTTRKGQTKKEGKNIT